MKGPKPTAWRRLEGGKRYLALNLAGLFIVVVFGLVEAVRSQANEKRILLTPTALLIPTPTALLKAPPPSLELLWKHETDHHTDDTPVVADGILYMITREVGDSSCLYYHRGWCYHLQALDMTTGKLKWTLDDYEYPLTVADGTIYSGWGGELHAIDLSTHQVKWKFKTVEFTKDEPFVTNDIRYRPMVADGVVYFGSGGTLYALDANSGGEVWSVHYADEIASSPVVFDNFVYALGDYIKMDRDVVKHHGNLYSVRRDNGQQLWKFEPSPGDWEPGAMGAPVVVAEGIVYCKQFYTGLNDPGSISAFNATTGQQLWNRSLTGTLDYSAGPLILYDSLLFIRDGEDNFHALDGKNGDERWKLSGGTFLSFGSAFVDDTMYGTNLDGEVIGVDIKSGKEISRYKSGKDFNLNAVVSDGIVYFVKQYPAGISLFGLPK